MRENHIRFCSTSIIHVSFFLHLCILVMNLRLLYGWLFLGLILSVIVDTSSAQIPPPSGCHRLDATFVETTNAGTRTHQTDDGEFPYTFAYTVVHVGVPSDSGTNIVSSYRILLEDNVPLDNIDVFYDIEFFSTPDCVGDDFILESDRLESPNSTVVETYEGNMEVTFGLDLCNMTLSYRARLSTEPQLSPFFFSSVLIHDDFSGTGPNTCITYTLCCPEPVPEPEPEEPVPVPTPITEPEPEEPQPEPMLPPSSPSTIPTRRPQNPTSQEDGQRSAFDTGTFGISVATIFSLIIVAIVIMLIVRRGVRYV